jgi:hypothetical protein
VYENVFIPVMLISPFDGWLDACTAMMPLPVSLSVTDMTTAPESA